MKNKGLKIFTKAGIITALIVAVFGVVGQQAFAANGINNVINFQGKVVDSSGLNVPDGTYSFVFKMYDGPGSSASNTYTEDWTKTGLFSQSLTGVAVTTSADGTVSFASSATNCSTLKNGQILTDTTKGESTYIKDATNACSGSVIVAQTPSTWATSDTVTNQIYVKNGIFRAAIGSLTSISGVNFGTNSIYLGVNFNGDGEMKPRVQYTSVPYAYNAQQVNGLTVTDTSGNPFSSTTTLKIAEGKTVVFNNGITMAANSDGNTFTLPSPTSGISSTVITNNASSQTIQSGQTSGTILSVSAGTPSLSGALTGMQITLDGTGAQTEKGLAFAVSGSGTLYDLYGTNGNWSITPSGALTVASCSGCGAGPGGSGANWWNLDSTNGVLYPGNISEDLLIGGTASNSARFHAFSSLNSGTTPAASVSAKSDSFAGFVVDNSGLGDLFTASASGQNRFVISNTGNVGIGTSTPSTALYVVGKSSAASVSTSATFTGDSAFTGWTTTNWTVSGGVATHSSGNTSILTSPTLFVTSGTVYQINFTLSSGGLSTDTLKIALGGQDSGNIYQGNFSGAITIYIKAPSSNTSLTFTPSSGYTGGISNVSVYPIATSLADMTIQSSNGGNFPLEFRAGGSGLLSTFIGTAAGQNSTSNYNTAVGALALQYNASGSYNTAVGATTLRNNESGILNAAFGMGALSSLLTGGSNTAVGDGALSSNLTGNSNTALGYNAGANNTGSNNLFLGNQAGYNETGSNKLYIANSNSTNPLIYGDFANEQLGINLPSSSGVPTAGSLGNAAMVVNQPNLGDIFTASSSGKPVVSITSGGNIVQTANVAPTIKGTVVDSTNLSGISGVYVVGKYAYSIESVSNRLTVVDVSNPASPVVVGSLLDNTNLNTADVISVAGKYAYVVGAPGSGGIFTVVDVSNPASPVVVGSLNDSTHLAGAQGEYISGKYAYVTSRTNNRLTVVNISNPAAPTVVGSIADFTKLSGAIAIYVLGKYAYVGANGTSRLTVVDVSNPSAPTIVGSLLDSTNLQFVGTIYVSGRYAYANGTSRLTVVDVSNPTAPVTSGSLNNAAFSGSFQTIYGAGKYVYFFSDSCLTVVDVSKPSAPTIVGSLLDSTNLYAGGIFSMYIAGKYAYATGLNRLSVIDITGIDAPAATIGNIATSGITVSEDLNVGNDGYFGNGLVVGNGGVLSSGGLVGTGLSIFNNTNNPTASISANSVMAGLIIDNAGGALNAGDIFTASSSGTTRFRITNAGGVLLPTDSTLAGNGITFGTTTPVSVFRSAAGKLTFGTATDGLTIDTNTSGTAVTYSGNARPTKQVVLSPEYAGVAFTAFYGAGTDTSITGNLTSDAEPSSALLRTYYQWSSTQTSLNYYTVAVRVTLPNDFSAWPTNGAITIDYYTDSNVNTNNSVNVYLYNSNDTPGTAVYTSSTLVSGTNATWSTLTLNKSDINDGVSPDWATAGHTAVIYLRLGSGTFSGTTYKVRIGDIKLNYLAKF